MTIPDDMTEITVRSSFDGSDEPSLLYLPPKKKDRVKIPLVTGLHTWSADRFNQVTKMLPFVQKLGWALLLPEFRGPNLDTNPRGKDACGSPAAKQDIVDAVQYTIRTYAGLIDEKNLFVLGGSGGGHMCCLMAGYVPALWRSVSAWCPITDVDRWHGENPHYARHIEWCCGGSPGNSAEAAKEAAGRSPVSYTDEISKAELHIHHGKWDQSVPFMHSYDLYTLVQTTHPLARVYLDIFDGGHDLYYNRAFEEFEKIVSRIDTAPLTG